MTLFSLFRRRTGKPSPELGLEETELPADPQLAGRYCRMLTHDPDFETLAEAWTELERNMTIVPAGCTKLAPVVLGLAPNAAASIARPIPIEAFYIDRRATINDEFVRFVSDGGYSQPELWLPEALPNLLQFVDRTGSPGPQSWSNCRPPADRGQHPVVGICWYEAVAYARWSGKRLLTPAEWQWAGGWSSSGGAQTEAKYPWGNTFDPQRANTWSSGIGDTVPVGEYYDGTTPNGVYQLIGNVWEWVSGSFEAASTDSHEQVFFDSPPAEIRGGAFDTYLETQASCLFRSCQQRLYRCSNIGFRCCVSVEELPSPPDPTAFV